MDKDLSLEDHLAELRRRLLICLLALVLLLIPAFLATPLVLPRIFQPLSRFGYQAHLYQITDGLLLRLRLALLLDITLLSPLLLLEALRFAWPGLWPGERRSLLLFALLAGFLFSAGVLLFILKLTPLFVAVWHHHGNTAGAVISAAAYYTVWQTAALVSGLACCLPALLFPGLRLHKSLEEN